VTREGIGRSLCWLIALVALLSGAERAAAQQDTIIRKGKGVRPGAPPPTRQPGAAQTPARAPGSPLDTTQSTERKDLVRWEESDSVMDALLARDGYVSTRYQGNQVRFDAASRGLTLLGKAAVEREQSLLVSDTIFYDDSAKLIRASASANDTIVLRDPHNQSDLISTKFMIYDLVKHEAVVHDMSTGVSEGETWYVHGRSGAYAAGDSSGAKGTAYALSGDITSCNLTEPHYHFHAGEVKYVSKTLIVARPAVLYIADIPVLWLPFLYQDVRSNRHSGILAPRFGFGDIVRTTPTYRRTVENIGYYFALSDYYDASVSLDWRSGARPSTGDAGYLKYNGSFNYNWLNRFMRGSLLASYWLVGDGQRSTDLTWYHSQDFSQRTHLRANINYQSNTIVPSNYALTAAQLLAAITSQLNFDQSRGPFTYSLGGTRTQHSGTQAVEQTFPNFSLASKPVELARWLLWTPQLSITNSEQLHEQPGVFRFQRTASNRLDSVFQGFDTRSRSLTFSTPVKVFDFNITNSVSVSDNLRDYPQTLPIPRSATDTTTVRRTFSQTFLTEVRYQTSVELPRFSQGKWNLVPQVALVQADPRGGDFIRTQLTGGAWVHQNKRFQYGISASPNFFGFFPGIGGISRFRHSISPQLTYTYSPALDTADANFKAFNQALGVISSGNLSGLAQNRLTLGLHQTIEGKLKAATDTNPDAGEKVKLLSLDFSPLTYDFERARQTHGSGFATPDFTYSARSDLLPGVDFTAGYSLFEGDPLSDTAVFKPYRTTLSASVSFSKSQSPFGVLARIFGRKAPESGPPQGSAADTGFGGSSPLDQMPSAAGSQANRSPIGIQNSREWNVSLRFNSQRSRPIRGNFIVVDPTAICAAQFIRGTVQYNQCVLQQQNQNNQTTFGQTTLNTPPIVTPPVSTLQANFTFQPTQKWAVQWSTGYDFARHEFSDHVVTLQRELHDWKAIFGFTQSPAGSFAFTFFISLNAEPDLKFDYDKSTYRQSQFQP
jgi:hypothetical protein